MSVRIQIKLPQGPFDYGRILYLYIVDGANVCLTIYTRWAVPNKNFGAGLRNERVCNEVVAINCDGIYIFLKLF
jgi:hypothetical protein